MNIWKRFKAQCKMVKDKIGYSLKEKPDNTLKKNFS